MATHSDNLLLGHTSTRNPGAKGHINLTKITNARQVRSHRSSFSVVFVTLEGHSDPICLDLLLTGKAM